MNTKFRIGDRVKLRKGGRLGTVRELFPTRVSVLWDEVLGKQIRSKFMTHYKSVNLEKVQEVR